MNRFLNQIICGDNVEVMRQMPDNCIDAVVTDPPYELGFMGKKWDSTGIAYNVELWQEVLRVLKPGGYLLAFGGTRTYHRMACAIEDAGFEIRDCIQWIYGSGFPKSMDISKAIDKKFGAEREVVGKYQRPDGTDRDYNNWDSNGKINTVQFKAISTAESRIITKPATPEAKQYSGWGTALKPANEPIVVARKPLSEKTVADNVLKWGTGGINIDGCRVEFAKDESSKDLARSSQWFTSQSEIYHNNKDKYAISSENGNPQGRFPANVIFDEEAGRLLDEQSGVSKAGGKVKGNEPSNTGQNGIYGIYGRVENKPFNDTGGASRFFYCAKASKKERGDSKHPTVKPLKLMRYLVRLVTPPNGIVLDPFTGSGTTLEASLLEGFSFIGIDISEEYCKIARQRVEQAQAQQSLFG